MKPLGSFAQNQFTLHARTPSFLNGQKIYFVLQDRYSQNEYKKVDSCFIQNDGFNFNGDIPNLCEYARIYLKADYNKSAIKYFIIDSGVNEMEIKSVNTSNSNKLSNVIIKNSKTNKLFDKLDSLDKKYFNLHARYTADLNSNKQIKVFDNLEKEKELNFKKLEIIKKSRDNYFSLLALYTFAHVDPFTKSPIYLLEVFDSLDKSIKLSNLGEEFFQEITERVNDNNSSKIGNKMPGFIVATSRGTELNSKDLIGKVCVIAFSATWCIPCQLYQKKLKRLYEKYKNKGLTVVYFNLDDNEKRWKEHIRQNQLEDWINVSEKTKMIDSKIAKTFFVGAIPTYFLVNKEGIICYNPLELKDANYDKLEEYILKAIN